MTGKQCRRVRTGRNQGAPVTNVMKVRAALLLLLLTALAVVATMWEPDQRATKIPSSSEESISGVNDRPNIVLISLDTVRPDHLGCYGYPRETTPNLDRLASGSVRFANVWAQAPWTLPSHMSLFTSLPPSRHRVDSISRVLPQHIPTWPQLLRQSGYRTAALVNNGQMRAHWGFSRGFELWHEYEVDTPAGNCEAITGQALRWLGSAPQEPWFLFLHYFDAHDPYEAPDTWCEKFDVTLTGSAAHQLAWEGRRPESPVRNSHLRDQLVAAYDAEIAWLDHELGRLFQAIDDDTMIVVLTDHGEAFEEHGWTLHGATLYEEEIRAALIIRYPGGLHADQLVATPASFLDVGPTILEAAHLDIPKHFMGHDLTPGVEGQPSAPRVVSSETKAVLDGRVAQCVIDYPWKAIFNLFDQSLELYRLPDEQTDLRYQHPEIAARLGARIESNLAVEDYRLLHLRGSGKHELTLKLAGDNDRLGLFIPAWFDERRDSIDVFEDGRQLRWVTYPRNGLQMLYLETEPRDAELLVEVLVNDQPSSHAVTFDPEIHPVSISSRTVPDREGAFIYRHRGLEAIENTPINSPLDERTRRQLRSLGYIR